MFSSRKVQRFQDWNLTVTRPRFGISRPLPEMKVSLPLHCLSALLAQKLSELNFTNVPCIWKVYSCSQVCLRKSSFCLHLAAHNILKDSEPGSFIIRDSQFFPGAFGLAVKVALPAAHVHQGLQCDLSKLKTVKTTSSLLVYFIALWGFPLIVCLTGPSLVDLIVTPHRPHTSKCVSKLALYLCISIVPLYL